MKTKRPNDMPGGLLDTLPWMFTSSSGFPRSELTFMFVERLEEPT